MSPHRIYSFALAALLTCAMSQAEQAKDSGKTDAHRLSWGGAVAGTGYPGYPGAYASAGNYEPRGYYPTYGGGYGGGYGAGYGGGYPPYGGYPAYPPGGYPGSYYPPTPWAFKTNEGKMLPK